MHENKTGSNKIGTMATPEIEIKRQHKEAISLIHHNLKFDRIEYSEEISCSWKEKPTIDDEYYFTTHPLEDEGKEEKQQDIYTSTQRHCVSIRGTINLKPIQELISKGYNNTLGKNKGSGTLWDEQRASKQNIVLTRPSHDSWGIQKILLIFCDDFIKRVYEMPWWRDNQKVSQSIRCAVQPVLDALNIKSSQIVRMLFANLPPGVTIPVHHDTGEWVKYTHRIHLPVIIDEPNNVVFRVGPTDDSLLRVPLDSNGTLFEINNHLVGPLYEIPPSLLAVPLHFFILYLRDNVPLS